MELKNKKTKTEKECACVFWAGSVSLSKQSTNSNVYSTTTSCFMTEWLKLEKLIEIYDTTSQII